MHWALLLHFYQPYGQKRQIVDSIAGQTYNPLLDGILKANRGRLSINLTGSLIDQLEAFGHHKLIEKFIEAGQRGLVEYVSTSKFHAILPMLPPAEARRQIDINNQTLKHHLGDAFNPRGLFLPEMAYSPQLAPTLESTGAEWVILDELAYNGKIDAVDYTKTYQIAGTGLKAIFREHRLSDTLMSAGVRQAKEFKQAIGPILEQKRYIISSMDGETFGHHRVGMEQLLFQMLADPDVNMVRMSELFDLYPQVETVDTVACTWASNEADLVDNIPYISWNDPTNPIHKLQWELMDLAIKELQQLPLDHPDFPRLRNTLDPALASDQLFWSSARPWWMIDHIESAAFALRTVVETSPLSDDSAKAEAKRLYDQIVGTSFEWQRSGKLDRMAKERDAILRIPFKERTADADGDGPAVWQAFIELMKEQQLAAAERTDYEAAAMWRDAIYKLEQKIDVYDAYHVVDILRAKLGDARVDKVIDKYRAEYNYIRGGQSEQRSH